MEYFFLQYFFFLFIASILELVIDHMFRQPVITHVAQRITNCFAECISTRNPLEIVFTFNKGKTYVDAYMLCYMIFKSYEKQLGTAAVAIASVVLHPYIEDTTTTATTAAIPSFR